MADETGINETIRKFGYPSSLIARYRHWLVLLRHQQVALGALVLACAGDATSFAGLLPAPMPNSPRRRPISRPRSSDASPTTRSTT